MMSDNPRVLGNRYEVGDLLGRGGMAEVHIGRDTRLGRVVAIKLLRTDLARDPIFQARFRREAQSAASLNHPAVVAVYDTGEEQLVDSGGSLVALPYIVMEYVEGRTLRELLGQRQPLDVALAIDLTIGVLGALEYSHRSGIVHRDIKPANVMLTAAGDVKVMDFGIARALADSSATMTQTHSVIGTAQYLSPEQARGETVDARSDLYSAGCLLFELVTGRPPFVADSPVAVAYQHVREAPPRPSSLNPAIGEDLDRILLHALAKDRETRYQSAGDFRADLENVRNGRAVAAPAAAASTTERRSDAGGAAATEYLGYQPQGTPVATRPLTTPMATGAPTRGLETPGGYYADPRYPDSGYGQGHADAGYGGYPPDRRGGSSQRRGRGAGYVLLGLVAVAVFASVAYLAYTLMGRGSQQVPVPKVTGMTEQVATATLKGLGLEVQASRTPSETVPAGVVTKQDPDTGIRVDKGTVVRLTVSSGSSSVQVPDLKNLTPEQARAALAKVGLTVAGTKAADNVTDVDKGKVSGSEPKATTTVAKGSGVTLLVASGKVQVPDVTDKNFTEANAILGGLKLKVQLQYEASDSPEGTVLSQDPAAGTVVEIGDATVTLRIATPNSQPSGEPSSPGPSEPQPSDQTPQPSAQGASPTP